jgi:hypothetical protein
MTCKRFGVYLEQMFKGKQLSDLNDPYYLMKHFENNEYVCMNQLDSIYNHNSLNFLSYNRKVIYECPLSALRQNCIVNNISRPSYLYKLFEIVMQRFPHEMSYILDILFDNKFYDIIKILSNHEHFLHYWIVSFIYKNKTFDEIKREIIILIDLDIATPEKIYELINQTLYPHLEIKRQILLIIKNTYNV